jgi:hypothetical protein
MSEQAINIGSNDGTHIPFYEGGGADRVIGLSSSRVCWR